MGKFIAAITRTLSRPTAARIGQATVAQGRGELAAVTTHIGSHGHVADKDDDQGDETGHTKYRRVEDEGIQPENNGGSIENEGSSAGHD